MKLTAGKVVVLIFVALGLITVVGSLIIEANRPPTQPRLASAINDATVASSPFTRFREMQLRVGKECKRVLVASTETQRVQGLRGVEALAPYDGMLFAFENDIAARFTMANTAMDIDITFYDAAGSALSTEKMTPCPGTDASCPTYGPTKPYRFALETEAGEMPSGNISPCS